MESKLTNICAQLSPGISGFALILLAFPGLVIGGAMTVFIDGFWTPIMILGCGFSLPVLVAHIALKDGQLSDAECEQLLSAAETHAAKSMVREIYREKGCLMKSDAVRILDWLHQRRHADVQCRMGCAS